MTVTFNTVIGALRDMANSGELSLPYGVTPLDAEWVDRDEAYPGTRWRTLRWNPPAGAGDHLTKPDADASPKPTWKDVFDRAVLLKLRTRMSELSYVWDTGTDRARSAAARRVPPSARDSEIYVGDGINHMTGIVHMLSDATKAGLGIPPMRLRTTDQHTVELFTSDEAAALLRQMSRATNAVESAHAELSNEVHNLTRIANDETVLLRDRTAAADKVSDLVLNYTDRLSEKAATHDPDALPEDLPRLRKVLIERLEAVATLAQKRLKGALSQQAIDNWAACVEIDKALQEIALECAVGAQNIANAEHKVWKRVSGTWENARPRVGAVTHEGEGAPGNSLGLDGDTYRDTASGSDNATEAFDTAVDAIRAVTPVNVPVFSHNISGRRVTVSAKNPASEPPIRGPVSQLSSSVASTDGSIITGKIVASATLPQKDSDPHESHFDFAAGYAGKIRIEIEVRNVCGPAIYQLGLDVTDAGPIKVL